MEENTRIKLQQIAFPKASFYSQSLFKFKNSRTRCYGMESARNLKHKLLVLGILSDSLKLEQLTWSSLDHKMISPRPVETSILDSGKTQYCCMMMRVSVDCKACHTKLRRILLSMKEVETHMIESQHDRVSICGRFRPSDVAVKVQKGMNRRVGILEIQEFDGSRGQQTYLPQPGYG